MVVRTFKDRYGHQEKGICEQGTLLMAMANRMPVISTSYHFAIEVLQDSRGIIIPYIDVNGSLLAKAMCDVLEDAAFRDKMVRAPRLYAQN